MTKASDNAYPSILVTEGTEPSAPAAGKQRLYIDSTSHKLSATNSSGVERLVEPSDSTSYTPALTAASSNPTLGSGSVVEGHYMQVGKLVTVWGSIAFGTSGMAGGTGEYRVSLPVTAVSTTPRIYGNGLCYDNNLGQFFLATPYFSSTTVFRLAITGTTPTVDEAHPFLWAASDIIIFALRYEAA